jgi:hypothetical protein
MVPQFARQKKGRIKPVPKGYKLLEEEGWSVETRTIAIILVVGRCPGLTAGEIAEAAANLRGLSPEARKVMASKFREKYKADTYHTLDSLKILELMEKTGGGYVLREKGRIRYQELEAATRAAPSVVDPGSAQVAQVAQVAQGSTQVAQGVRLEDLAVPVLIVHQVRGIITEH